MTAPRSPAAALFDPAPSPAAPPESGAGPAAAPAVASPSVAAAFFDAVERDGTDTVFSIPGSAITPMYQALQGRRRMKHILARSEQGAGYMAYGYGLLKRSVGVCMATTGPGGTNFVTPAACAQADSVPMIVVSGENSTGYYGKNATQDSTALGADLVGMFGSVTKLATQVGSGAVARRILDRALVEAHSGRPGPVALSLPVDVQKQPVGTAPAAGMACPPSNRVVDLEAVADLVALLSQALRPAILAGSGVLASGGAAALFDVATRLRIPVASTPKAKGVFPESHPLSLGVFGFGGHPRAEAYLCGGCDVLVVVGSSLGELTTNHFDPRLAPPRALVQIDIDPTQIGRNYRVDLPVVGDARAVLQAVTARASHTGEDRWCAEQDPLAELRRTVPAVVAAESLEGEGGAPLKPQRLVTELRAVLPADAHLFVDIGNAIIWAGHYFTCETPGTYHVPLGFAAMGAALCAAIGGKLAAPDKDVVALVGDGAFFMNGLEIATAVEYDVPVTWIVMNNGGHGMVYHGEKMVFGTDLGASRFRAPVDAAGVARALGAEAETVRTADEFRAALQRALASGRPYLIDAHVDAEEVPQPLAQRAKALSANLKK